MDTNNWRSTPPGGEPGIDTSDWRTQLQPESRQRIIIKILDTLKKHLPISRQEGLTELEKIVGRFEEKTYTAATSQPDYLRRISMKMLTMEQETQPQNPAPSSLPSNSAGNGNQPPDPELKLKATATECEVKVKILEDKVKIFEDEMKHISKFKGNSPELQLRNQTSRAEKAESVVEKLLADLKEKDMLVEKFLADLEEKDGLVEKLLADLKEKDRLLERLYEDRLHQHRICCGKRSRDSYVAPSFSNG